MKNKRKRKANNMARCPYCGKPARIISAAGILPASSKVTQLLACSNYPECDSYVCVHPGTSKPMGTVADPTLRRLRQEAHHHFNKIYQSGIMPRKDAYNWMADKLLMPLSEAHIGRLSEYSLQLIIAESKKLLAYRRSLAYQSRAGDDRRMRA